MRIKKVTGIKPKIKSIQTSTQYVVEQGITYNEPGITYNEPGIMYGGYSNVNISHGETVGIAKITDTKPRLFKAEVRTQAQFYRGIPYGLLLSLTYP